MGTDTVGHIKALCHALGMHERDCRLIYDNRAMLDESRTLASHAVVDGATIHHVLAF